MATTPVSVLFRGDDKLSASIIGITRRAKEAARALDDIGLITGRQTRDMSREFAQVSEEMERLRGKDLDMDQIFGRASRSASEFRSVLNRLDSMAVSPTIDVRHHEAQRRIESIREGMASLRDTSIGIVIGLSGGNTFDDVTSTSHAAAQYKTLTGKDDEALRREMSSLSLINPQKDRSEIIGMLTEATMYNKKDGGTIAGQALKLNMIRPDMGEAGEYQKALFSMKNSMPNVKDVQRFGDSLAYIVKNTQDIRGEALDSIIEYSPQVSKFLNTPEKVAALTREMNGLWSLDKGFDALKETTLKLYNQGDLENVIKTAYETQGIDSKTAKTKAGEQAEIISGRMSSGSEIERQIAVGTMMQIFGGMKDDKVRQNLLNELGAGPGEDLTTNKFAQLLVVAGKISTDDASKYNYNGTLERTYQQTKENDPLSDFANAKKMLKDEFTDLGITVAQNVAPAMKLLANGVGWITQKFDGMSAVSTIGMLVVGALGGALALGGIKKAASATNEAFWGALGKGASKISSWRPWQRKKEEEEPFRRHFTRAGGKENKDDPIQSLSSMNIRATHVYINGSVSGNGQGGRGRNARDKLGDLRDNIPDSDEHTSRRRKRTISRDRAQDLIGRHRPDPPEPPKKGLWGKIKDSGLVTRTKGLVKGAGVVGALTAAGMGAYDLYQASKQDGWRQAISTRGGAVAGGVVGGAVGGAVGSLLGPAGTMVGAAAGNWVGDKLGGLMDKSGVTKNIVDSVVSAKEKVTSFISDAGKGFDSLKGKVSSWWNGDSAKKAESDVKAVENAVQKTAALPPPKVKPIAPETWQKMKAEYDTFVSSLKQKGVDLDFTKITTAGKKVTDTFSEVKNYVVGLWKGSDSKKAQTEIKAVGVSAQKTGTQAKQMGTTTTHSTQEIIQGARKAGQSFSGVSSAAAGAVNQVKQKLESLRNVSSQGSSWGSNLISMLAAGIQSKFPLLSSVVTTTAGIIKKNLGFSSPTKEGPASKSDKWAPNFISMFASGLKADPIKQKMNLIAGTMNRKLHNRASIDVMQRAGNGIRVARSLNQAPRAAGSVSIQNITLDFGEMAKQVTNFTEFAKMLSGPQGRALIRKVVGEELHKAIENGG